MSSGLILSYTVYVYMRQNIHRFIQIQQERGIKSALGSTKSYISNRLEPVKLLKNKYWDINGGTQTLSIGNQLAEFDATTDCGGDTVRWMYNAEERFLNDMLSELNQDDVFFDIGANLGIFSCFASSIVSEGHVVAFEPYPPNVAQLTQNLSYNANESDYDVLDVALSDSRGTVNFSSPDNDPGNQTANIIPAGDSIEVETVAGDELLDDDTIQSPTVIKIDVEGAEPLVFDGLEHTLNDSSCRLLYCEIHLPTECRPSVEDYDESKESMLRRISEFGFDIVYSETRGNEVHVKGLK